MLYAPYRNADYDAFFEKLITETVSNRTTSKDDDYIMFCTGVTGSGKTRLMFHAYELYDYENCSMEFIALKRENYADALKHSKDFKGKRFVGYDEANISKRDSLTKWNKDIIDLLFAIRGLNIFQWHNNPSVEMLDKALVREKINGLIFVATKSQDKPRIYFFFTKERILEMLDKYEYLTIDILKDNGIKFCNYVGWFKDYKGKLLSEYLKVKENRMKSKIDDFHCKWGTKCNESTLKVSELANECKISANTVRVWHDELVNNNLLIDGKHFTLSTSGYRMYYPEAKEVFEKLGKEKLDNTTKRLQNQAKTRRKHNKIGKVSTKLSSIYTPGVAEIES